jgi:hypothetical protein
METSFLLEEVPCEIRAISKNLLRETQRFSRQGAAGHRDPMSKYSHVKVTYFGTSFCEPNNPTINIGFHLG